MSGFIVGVDRGQVSLFPERLEDWIDEDHPVRVIDLFVDDLDLMAVGFLRTAAARTGRPAAETRNMAPGRVSRVGRRASTDRSDVATYGLSPNCDALFR